MLKDSTARIRKAIENYKEIEFTYIDSAGVKTSRRAEPYSLVLKGQKWYLYAWCHMREDFRLFKLSRIRELVTTDISYEPKNVSMGQLTWKTSGRPPKIQFPWSLYLKIKWKVLWKNGSVKNWRSRRTEDCGLWLCFPKTTGSMDLF